MEIKIEINNKKQFLYTKSINTGYIEVGRAYRVFFKNHPMAKEMGDYGDGTICLCVGSCGGEVYFTHATEIGFISDSESTMCKLRVPDLDIYDIDIVKCWDENEIMEYIKGLKDGKYKWPKETEDEPNEDTSPKKIKCVVRKIEMRNGMLPYSTIYIPSTDKDLMEAVGQTAIISTNVIAEDDDDIQLGSSMSVAVDTYMENDGTYCEPDDGCIYVSSDVYSALFSTFGFHQETLAHIFYNLDSNNIKEEFPELFECDDRPFMHHYKTQRTVSLIRDGEEFDNTKIIFVDKHDPIVTTEGVAQPVHVNKLNEIPTVSCFIQPADRYMLYGNIGVSKYMADMFPLKIGDIVDIDIIVHSSDPIKKNPSHFDRLSAKVEYESISSKDLHIEQEIRNGKITAFSICKDRDDTQEEETTDETD